MLRTPGLVISGAVAAIILSHVPASAFTQADCDNFKKLQSDPSGREINAKMRADSRGSCIQEPPNQKDAKLQRKHRSPGM